jgi:superfamily II DNA or RNA helicase
MPTISIGDRETCDDALPPAVQPLPPGVTPGATVTARGTRWQLDAVVVHPDCRELHLRSDRPPCRRVLLWPFDRPAAAERGPRVKSVRLQAWAATVGLAIRGAVDPLTPRARVSAAAILPYQLAPAVAMAGGVSRVLLADEVGLGKTIQAGWMIADLLGREPGARVLAAVPAGLRRQWCTELSARFDITAIAVDARWLRRHVADIPADVSPWAAPGVYLGSVDFLKRVDVAASLDAHVWDLLVVDEAHNATSPTERHAALSAVAARARRVVTITATPYSGDAASFTSMAALGAAAGDPPPLMFRRSREDVGDPRRRRHRFAAVRIHKTESRLQRLLERYSRSVWRNAPTNVEGARLAVTILRKRALSSAAAAARSLRRRLDLLDDLSLDPALACGPHQLRLFDEDDDVGDDLPEAALGAPGFADAALERRWLTKLIEAADGAAGADSKLRHLRRLVRRVGGEPVIVFTEYRDTLLQLASALPPSLQLHGGLTASERTGVQARFNEIGGLLLATDAAAEGLNLQRRCRIVVNYELPWNPARLEQRIGRIDRIGQERAVHAMTLVARDTAEDLVIANLARRLARVVATLGEQDRLGAFLSDARTARMVIGGAAPDDVDETAVPSATMTREPAVGDEARAAADRLSLRRTRVHFHGPCRQAQGPPDLVVSTLRAPAGMPSSIVAAVHCVARTEDGDLVADRVLLVQAHGDAARPATPAAARSIAATAVEALPNVRDAFPEVARWFATVTGIHERSIDSRLAREVALHDRAATSVPVQPGLFDRRPFGAAEDLSDTDRATRTEHRRRIAAFERARRTRLSCTPMAVLIVWR